MTNGFKFDAIVIGAGHNGLTTAANLSQAGLITVVLERRDVVGGCAVIDHDDIFRRQAEGIKMAGPCGKVNFVLSESAGLRRTSRRRSSRARSLRH